MGGHLRRVGGSCPDAKFLYAVAERIGMKIQDLRSAIRTLDFAVGLVKNRKDVVSLKLIQGGQCSC